MQSHHVGDRLKGVPRLAQIGHLWDLPPNDAQHRLKILQCFARYGLAATREAFLEARGITHWWPYPRSPTMNAHVERFNRTLQEQFVDYHEALLFDDLAAFNRKLADWLVAYNTVLPHHSLQDPSPVQFLLHQPPECQWWWTHTPNSNPERLYV